MAEYIEGIKVVFDADYSEFKKQMSQVNKELNNTGKEAKALADSLKLEWDPDKFVKAQQAAQKAIEGTEQKAQILRERLKQMEEAGITEKNREEYRKWQVELTKTETAVQKLKKQLEDLDKIRLENLGKGFKEFGDKVSQLGQKLTPISATAAGVVASITALTKKTVDYGDEIQTLADKFDLTAEQMQRFQYIAMQTDVENERLTKGFTALRGAMGEALLGQTNNATKALETLGFTLQDINTRSQEDMFMETIKRLNMIENSTLQAALANQIFGERLAQDLIPLIKSADALDALNQEFDTLGYLTDEQIGKLAEFDNVMNRIKTAFANVARQIGVAFLPVFESIAGFIEEKIVPNLQKFVEWINNLSNSAKGMIVGVGSVVAALAPVLLIIGKISSGIGNMIPMITKLGGAMQGALGPVGIIIGLMAIMYAKNEQFRESINNLIGVIMRGLKPILDLVMKIFNVLIARITPLIDILATLLTPMIEFLSLKLEVLFSILTPIIEKVGEFIMWIENLRKKLYDLVLNALEPVIGKLEMVWDWIRKILKLDNKKVLDVEVNRSINDTLTTTTTSKVLQEQEWMRSIITNNESTLSNISNVKNYNDNSVKNFNINLTIQNFGEELDYDEVVRQINLRLAEQF